MQTYHHILLIHVPYMLEPSLANASTIEFASPLVCTNKTLAKEPVKTLTSQKKVSNFK